MQTQAVGARTRMHTSEEALCHFCGVPALLDPYAQPNNPKSCASYFGPKAEGLAPLPRTEQRDPVAQAPPAVQTVRTTGLRGPTDCLGCGGRPAWAVGREGLSTSVPREVKIVEMGETVGHVDRPRRPVTRGGGGGGGMAAWAPPPDPSPQTHIRNCRKFFKGARNWGLIVGTLMLPRKMASVLKIPRQNLVHFCCANFAIPNFAHS